MNSFNSSDILLKFKVYISYIRIKNKVYISYTIIIGKVYHIIEAFINEEQEYFNRYEFDVIVSEFGYR